MRVRRRPMSGEGRRRGIGVGWPPPRCCPYAHGGLRPPLRLPERLIALERRSIAGMQPQRRRAVHSIQHPLQPSSSCWHSSRLPVHRIGFRLSARARPYPNKSSRQAQGPSTPKTQERPILREATLRLSSPTSPPLSRPASASAPLSTWRKPSIRSVSARSSPSPRLPSDPLRSRVRACQSS